MGSSIFCKKQRTNKLNQMRLTAEQLKDINKNLRDIHIELDWRHGKGEYIKEAHEVESKGYLIVIDISCHGSAIKRPSGFMEEPTYTNQQYSKTIYSITVYDLDGFKLMINDKQFRSIEHNLINNIYIS